MWKTERRCIRGDTCQAAAGLGYLDSEDCYERLDAKVGEINDFRNGDKWTQPIAVTIYLQCSPYSFDIRDVAHDSATNTFWNRLGDGEWQEVETTGEVVDGSTRQDDDALLDNQYMAWETTLRYASVLRW